MLNFKLKKKTKKKITSFFREIIIVISGILIALYISKVSENNSNKNYLEKAKASIEKEIITNKKDLKKIITKHNTTQDTIDEKLDSKESLREIIEDLEGFQVPEGRNIGLRFFVSKKAELIEFETISYLSRIEFQTEIIQQKINKLIAFLYDNMENTNKESKEKFYIFLDDLIESEEGLLKSYNAYLDKN